MNIQVHQNLSESLKLKLLDLWNNEYPKDVSYSNLSKFEKYLNKLSKTEHLIYIQDQDPKAWLLLFDRDGSRHFGLIVSREFQGKGVGSELVSFAKHRERHLEGWVLSQTDLKRADGTSYQNPLEFYKKNGFTVSSEEWTHPRLKASKIKWSN